MQYNDSLPDYNFNSEIYVLEFVPSEAEIKLSINLLGVEVIQVEDINQNLKDDTNIIKKLWPVYFIIFVNSFGLTVVFINLLFYAQFIGS